MFTAHFACEFFALVPVNLCICLCSLSLSLSCIYTQTEADPLCSDYDSECIFCGSKYEGPCEK